MIYLLILIMIILLIVILTLIFKKNDFLPQKEKKEIIAEDFIITYVEDGYLIKFKGGDLQFKVEDEIVVGVKTKNKNIIKRF